MVCVGAFSYSLKGVVMDNDEDKAIAVNYLHSFYTSFKIFDSDELFCEFLDSCEQYSQKYLGDCKDEVYRVYLVWHAHTTWSTSKKECQVRILCFVNEEADIANIADEARMLAEDHIRDFTDVTRYDD
jgi:hypothetical protein